MSFMCMLFVYFSRLAISTVILLDIISGFKTFDQGLGSK